MFHAANLNELAESWRLYVWHAGWQSTLVALVILGVVCGLRRAPSPLRYGLLLVALVKFMMPPMLAAPIGIFSCLAPQVTITPTHPSDVVAPSSASIPIGAVAHNERTRPADSESVGSMPVSSESSPFPSSLQFIQDSPLGVPERLSLNGWLMLIHLVGMGIFVGWFVLMLLRLSRTVARSTSLTEGSVYDQFNQVAQTLGVRRQVRLVLGEHTTAPIAFGICRPSVLLPICFVEDLQTDQLQTVFAHELGHHRRLDLCANLLQLLILAAWWFNPLVWVLNWVLRRVREDCCDDLVLGLGLSTHLSYSETLIKVAAQVPTRPTLGTSLGFSETFHPLTHRIKRIIESVHPQPVRLSLVGLGCVLLVSGALLPGLHSGQNDVKAHQISSPDSASVDEVHGTSGNSADEIAQGHVQLQGKVMSEVNNGSLAGAVVHLLKRGQPWNSAKTVDVRTDDQGQFNFEAVEPGDYRIWATHGDLVSRQARYKGRIVKVAKDGAAIEPVLLQLDEGCTLRVRALSSITGQPLAQANVHLTWSDIGNDFPSDETGLIVIKSLTQESWQYEVTAPGHGRVTRVANLQRGTRNIFEIRLPAGGTLSGVVMDQNHQGIEGVGVNLYPTGNGTPLAYVKTDKDGAYQLPYVPVNTSVDVRYHYKNFVSGSKRKIILTEPDQVRTLDVQLEPTPLGGSVTGFVANQKNQPIHNASVIFHTGSSNDVRKVKTDASGRFRMDDIPDRLGNMPLTIRAKGCAPKNVDIEPGTPQTPRDLSIRLLPGHAISGKVVDESGHPIPDVWVFAGGNRFPNRMGGNTHTDQEGRFAFDSLPATMRFDFQARGYSRIQNESLALDRKDHVIVMTEKGVIAGQVVDAESGAPIPFFNIKPRRSSHGYPGGLSSSLGREGVDFTSKEGRFYLDDLIAGAQLMLLVEVPGSAVQVYDRVMIHAASKSEPVTLKYRVERGLLAGHIVDVDDHALANLKVHAIVHKRERSDMHYFDWRMLNSGQLAIQPAIIQIKETATDVQGNFQFEGMAPGHAIDLTFQGEGIPKTRREQIEMLSGSERAKLVIKLAKASTITGRINAQKYPNVRQLSVHLKGDSSSRRTIKIGADQHTYTFTDLSAGTYLLRVHGKLQPGPIEGTFTNARLGTISFDIKTAESKQIDIGF